MTTHSIQINDLQRLISKTNTPKTKTSCRSDLMFKTRKEIQTTNRSEHNHIQTFSCSDPACCVTFPCWDEGTGSENLGQINSTLHKVPDNSHLFIQRPLKTQSSLFSLWRSCICLLCVCKRERKKYYVQNEIRAYCVLPYTFHYLNGTHYNT